MSTTQFLLLTFETVSCFKCHAPFGMERNHYEQRKRDHESFWCPTCGQEQVFTGETPLQRARREAKDAENLAASRLAALDQAHAEIKHQRSLTKRANTIRKKLETRVAAGVCPCCHRTVSQLARHMNTKHPDFGGRQ